MHKDDQTEDVNWAPLSEVILEGTPNREIQPFIRALAQELAVIDFKGIASGHLVDLSTIVNKYENPSEGGSGPTKSM